MSTPNRSASRCWASCSRHTITGGSWGTRKHVSERSQPSSSSFPATRRWRSPAPAPPPAKPKGSPMALTLPLPRISTNVRFPELASAIAERLFLTPPKPRDAAAAAVDLIDARSSVLEHNGRHIVMWRWGSRDAPAVLLAHGWGGNAAQMRPFAFPLLEAGHRVIAYDQPAHGVSEGRLTGLPDFADVLGAVAAYHGGIHAVIAHSLGGAAAALSLSWGRVAFHKIVLVAPPSDLVGYSRRF